MGKQTMPSAKRSNLFIFDPSDLTIVGLDTEDGEEHPLYDERAFLPLDETLVLNIQTYGVIEPISICKDGDQVLVVDGRRRVLHAREAATRQKAAGELLVRVPAVVKKGSEGRLLGISRSANAHRRDDSPLANARNAQRIIDFGEDEESIAITYGVEVQTVKTWLKLLDLDNTVQKAVEKGELGATAAARMSNLTRDEQKTTLAEMRESGQLSTAAVTATVRAKRTKTDRVVAPGKRVLRKLVEAFVAEPEESEFSEDFIEGVKFAIGDLNPRQIKGLTAALREAGFEVQ